MTTIATLAIKITADNSGLTSGLSTAQSSVDNFARSAGGSMAALGKKMIKFGALAGVAVAGGVAAIGIASVKTAISMESAFTGVIKTTDGLVDEFGNLNDVGLDLQRGFRDLALEIPTHVEELMRIGELGGQLGIQKENLLGFTETIAALGETTNLSVEEGSMAFARLANILGTSQTDFDRMGSTVVDLGNNFATTEADIVAYAERIAGAGKLAGLTEAQVFAIGTAMSSVGVQAQAGGTSVQKVLNAMTEAVATNSEELGIFAKVAGVSAEEFAEMYEVNAGGAFADFVEGLGMAGDSAFGILDDLGLKNEQVVRSFLSLAGAGDLVSETMDMAEGAWESNTALAAEAATRYRTTESQMKLFKNTIKDVGITVGSALLPVVNEFLELAKPLIKSFGDKVPKAMEKIMPVIEGVSNVLLSIIDAGFGSIEMWEALGGLIGEDLVNQIRPFVDAFSGFIKDVLIPFATEHKDEIVGAIKAVGVALVAAGIISTLIGIGTAIVTFITSPLGIVIGIIALLGAAWAGNWFGIRDTLTAVWEGTIKPALESLAKWLGEVIPPIIEAMKNFWETALLPAIQKVVEWLGPKLEKVMEGLAKFWDTTLKPALSKLADWLGENIPKAIDALTEIWNNVLMPALEFVMGWIDNVAMPIFEAVAEVVGAVVGKALEALAGIWQNVLQPALETVWDFIKTKLLPVLEEKLGPVLEWLNDEIIQPVIGGFGGIIDVVEKVVGWLGDLADMIGGIELPAWMTPGSATPFEIGLRGIADGLREVHKVGFPEIPDVSGFGTRGGKMVGAMAGGGSIDMDELARIIGEVGPSVNIDAQLTNDVDVYNLAYQIADILSRKRR